MKQDRTLFRLGILTLLVVLFACKKSISDTQTQTVVQSQPHDSTQQVKTDTPTAPIAPFPQAPITGCAYDPNYGDSIIYPQPTNGQDYIVSPINNPGPGKYMAWPAGMVIDSLTGAIDVTKSNTGERYAIGFIKSGTTDTCLTPLIIGGADYMDSVYVLADNATQAVPYFDANPYLASICSGQGNGGNSCSFDVTGSAAAQKVIVNSSTGVIDLQKTLNGTSLPGLGGAFGLLPTNGQTASATIYYKLNDASNLALQHIDVSFVYYDSKSNMTAGLLNSIVGKLDDALLGHLILPGGNPRPPLIVIVRRL
jgi:hypothetical protein